MEFKISDKSKKNLEHLIEELDIESKMSKEACENKKKKDALNHIAHLQKYHFKSSKEMFDYIYNGGIMYNDGDMIKLMDNGLVGQWSLWLSDDDCCVLGYFWRTKSKEEFEKWVNLISQEDHLDNGYLPVWHKV